MATILELLTHNGKAGTGYFDTMMRSVTNHVVDEYESQRISANEYAKIYVETLGTTLQSAIAYILQAPKAFAELELVQTQIDIAKADLAIRQKDLELREKEILLKTKEIEQITKQLELIDPQKAKLVAETANIAQNTANAVEQGKALVHETTASMHKATATEYRAMAEYASTHDMLPDGQPVAGSIGKDNATKVAQSLSLKARDMYQVISGNVSSNTAQITTLSDVTIAPSYTTGANIDKAIGAYYSLIGVNVPA